MNVEMERFFENTRYNDNFMQMIRGLTFFMVDADESRDAKALVILAEYAKKWAEGNLEKNCTLCREFGNCRKLTPEDGLACYVAKSPLIENCRDRFKEWCDKIIAAGSLNKYNELGMPLPWLEGLYE